MLTSLEGDGLRAACLSLPAQGKWDADAIVSKDKLVPQVRTEKQEVDSKLKENNILAPKLFLYSMLSANCFCVLEVTDNPWREIKGPLYRKLDLVCSLRRPNKTCFLLSQNHEWHWWWKWNYWNEVPVWEWNMNIGRYQWAEAREIPCDLGGCLFDVVLGTVDSNVSSWEMQLGKLTINLLLQHIFEKYICWKNKNCHFL